MSNNGDTTLESGTPSPPPTRECPDSLHILDALPYLSFEESIISVDGVEMNNLPYCSPSSFRSYLDHLLQQHVVYIIERDDKDVSFEIGPFPDSQLGHVIVYFYI